MRFWHSPCCLDHRRLQDYRHKRGRPPASQVRSRCRMPPRSFPRRRTAEARAELRAPPSRETEAAKVVNINSASEKELLSLPDVTKQRAEAIIQHRPYKDINELVSRGIIPKNEYNQINDRIIASDRAGAAPALLTPTASLLAVTASVTRNQGS